MRTRTPALLAAATLASALMLTACSPGSPVEEAPGTLEDALAAIPATEENLLMIAYTDVSAAAELGAYDDVQHPFATAGALGYGNLAPTIAQLDPALLPDADTDDASALWVGQPPNTALRFDGVDGEAAEAFFADAEGERSDLDDGSLLVRRADGEVDITDDFLPPQVMATMNTVWVGESTLVGASTEDAVVSLVEGTDESAADAEVYAGVTDCLGDVVAAELHSGEPAAPAASLAIGFGGTAEEPLSTLCVRSEDPAAMADTIRESLADGVDPRNGQPWQDMLGETEVTESGDWVQLQIVDTERPSLILDMLHAGSIPALLGEADPATTESPAESG
ncbi:MAG TPA: hypothetical protein H9815_20075 [Candidatus Ruania gallistercoris]|uniref:DUF3352 domain-containing protein n=1 Tax=Candidatus Ruania gallistercoris TaxID=2838746 RepID=A0A9D2EIM2_9MICO|nr:hypothetical protein [Candidatus Ruania gallistercoris]